MSSTIDISDSPEALRERLARVRADRAFLRSLLDLGESENLEELLERALELVVSFTDADQGYIELGDQNDEAVGHYFRASGLCDRDVSEIRAQVSHGITAQVLASGRTVETDSAMDDERFRARSSVRENRISAVLCAPVGTRPPIGVVYLQRRETPGRFSPDHRERVELFARHLATCADRLLAHRATRALTDHTADVRRRFHAPRVIGRSERLAHVLEQAARVAPLPRFDILLTGPSGSGKNELARAIHDNSPCASGPFVELNCGAIVETLAESELFGSVAGAHSTATKSSPGRVDMARGGTLFLDEITSLSPANQAALLQFLQSRAYYPVGGSAVKRADDVRVISASNADLSALVRAGRLREDLYYRLVIFPIELPGLAERRDDIPLIAEHVCRRACIDNQLPETRLSRDALIACREAEWPGNIRELAAAVQRAVIHAHGEDSRVIEARHLFARGGATEPRAKRSLREATFEFRRRHVLESLERNQWNVSAAARELDIQRTHLHELIRTLELARPDLA